ncbi:F-box domain-containing protein [Hirschfeldia incana]|nr:F-box domain-containing protein [Hirschfeldia incana]
MGVSKMKLSWSELCPDLLRCVYERLSFTDLTRAKSVCSSWHSASRGFLPKRNQNPWLILFPGNDGRNDNNGTCLFLFPGDKNKVYKNRDLGVDFARSRCLATYGSWLLMMDHLWNLNILNLLIGEKIDLPALTEPVMPERFRPKLKSSVACLWIDEKTKDYLVVWTIKHFQVFTKRGINTWRGFASNYVGEVTGCDHMVYNHKDQKLYGYRSCYDIRIWCFRGDDEPQEVFEAESACFTAFNYRDFLPKWWQTDDSEFEKDRALFSAEYVNGWINLALTVSGQVLKVSIVLQRSKRWLFRIHKISHVTKKWKEIDSLGEEALILDMGITVVAKHIPGIKRNSIYFSGVGCGREDLDNIFVFDLATQNIQRLPQCVFSPINFSDARWFFPGLSN